MEDESALSRYDYHFRTYHCCVCQQPISLSCESEALLVQDQLDEWRRTNELLPAELEQQVRERVHEERGERFSDRQYIHCRCLAPLTRPEQQALRQRGEFPLPSRDTHHFYPLTYDGAILHCDYCRIALSECEPGVAYRANAADWRTRAYLHYACYARIAKQRLPAVRTPQGEYDAIPGATSGDLDPVATRRQNNAWQSAMSRRQLQTLPLRDYRAWRDARDEQRGRWSDTERAEWAALGEDALEANEAQVEVLVAGGDAEREVQQRLVTASYPLSASALGEATLQWNLLRARGHTPLESARKRSLDED